MCSSVVRLFNEFLLRLRNLRHVQVVPSIVDRFAAISQMTFVNGFFFSFEELEVFVVFVFDRFFALHVIVVRLVRCAQFVDDANVEVNFTA